MKNLVTILLVIFSVVIVSCKKEKLEPITAPSPTVEDGGDTTNKNPYSFTLITFDYGTYATDTVDYASDLYKIMNKSYYLVTINGDTAQDYREQEDCGLALDSKTGTFTEGKFKESNHTQIIHVDYWYTIDKEGTKYGLGGAYSTATIFEILSYDDVTGSFSVRVASPVKRPDLIDVKTNDTLVYIRKL